MPSSAPQKMFRAYNRAQSWSKWGQTGLTVRAAAAGLSNDSGAESPVGQQFVKSVLAVGAASILAASGVQTVGPRVASMAAEALAAVESSAPLVGGTAVVSSMASAAATLGLTRRAEKEQTARQRTRLEKLRSEVVKLQELQGQELALLQQQMSAKAQDFAVAWERVQDDLSRESAERELVQQQLALAQSKNETLSKLASMEAAERERLSAINSELAVQLVAQQQQVLSLEAAAAALAADAEAARSSADMVASQLEAAASWQRHASEENKKLRQSRSPSPGLASASLLEAKSAEAAAMQAALDEVRANAAAARAALEAAESRNAVLDKAHAKAAAEALQLATEKRQLAAALKSARSQAAALGGQLEAARALAPQLQAARAAAADTAALLASAHSRSSVLEKAWAAATKNAEAQSRARSEAQAELEWARAQLARLASDLDYTESSVSHTAAGVEALVAQLNSAMDMAGQGEPWAGHGQQQLPAARW